jgi:hypothetical protein
MAATCPALHFKPHPMKDRIAGFPFQSGLITMFVTVKRKTFKYDNLRLAV